MDKTDLCRLCALDSDKNELISLFDEQGIKVHVAEKITKLLNIELSKSTNLPKSICTDCCNKLEAFDQFLNASRNAQITLSLLFPEDGKQSENNTLPHLEDLCKQVDCISPLPDEFLRDEGVNGKGDSLYDVVNSCDLFACGGKKTSPESVASIQDGLSERSKKGAFKKPKDWIPDSWLCSDCSEVSSSLEELKLHHNTDHKQDVRFMCVVCSKIFLIYSGFVAHMKRHTIPSCEFCGKDFCDKKTLERHRRIHSPIKSFSCGECGRAFRHQHTLLVHSKCHLPEDVKDKFPCQLCDKKFSTKPNLRSHMRIHSGVKDFTCDQCGRSFTQKGNLDAHLATHSLEKPFSCHTCDKRFKSELQVKKHQTIHTNERPFQCDICGQTFREKRNLREHHRIHTGVLPYTCEFCGKSFRFRGILLTHRRTHTGERPYSCVQCQHHFTNWPNFNKHMKRRHGINMSKSGGGGRQPAQLHHQEQATSAAHHPLHHPQGQDVNAALVVYSDQLVDGGQELFLGGQAHLHYSEGGHPTHHGGQFVYAIDASSPLDIIPR